MYTRAGLIKLRVSRHGSRGTLIEAVRVHAAAEAASAGAGGVPALSVGWGVGSVTVLPPFGVGLEAAVPLAGVPTGFGLLNVTVLLYRLTLAAAAKRALSAAGLNFTVGSVGFSPRWNSPGSVVRPVGC